MYLTKLSVVLLWCALVQPAFSDWFDDLRKCYEDTTPCCGKECICTETCVKYGSYCRCKSRDVVMGDPPVDMATEFTPVHYDRSTYSVSTGEDSAADVLIAGNI